MTCYLADGFSNFVRDKFAAAYFHFQKGAEEGDELCMFYLGVMYRNGYYVEKNSALALKWFMKGHKKGQVDCTYKAVEMMIKDLPEGIDRKILSNLLN